MPLLHAAAGCLGQPSLERRVSERVAAIRGSSYLFQLVGAMHRPEKAAIDRLTLGGRLPESEILVVRRQGRDGLALGVRRKAGPAVFIGYPTSPARTGLSSMYR
jgi:hypothetical protein